MCTMRGMRRVGETARAVTQVGGVVWAGAVTMRAGVSWELAVPLPHMLVHWQQLSMHQALHICQIALPFHMGHNQ